MKHKLFLLNHSVTNEDESIGAMFDGLEDVTFTEEIRIIDYNRVPFNIFVFVNDGAGKLLEREEEHLGLIN